VVYTIGLYISLLIFIVGMIYKISAWFRFKIGSDAKSISVPERVLKAVKGITRTVLGANLLLVIKIFIRDIIFQKRLLDVGFVRWLGHMLISYGFMALLLMHAFQKYTTSQIFDDYYSTLNPFLFLRNIFAAMLITGISMVVYRRFVSKENRTVTNLKDMTLIIILAFIIISGMILEGAKISSYSEFQIMVEDYLWSEDTVEIRKLEGFWVEKYGLSSLNISGSSEQSFLDQGREVHEMNCAECHSSSKWAFGGYSIAKAIKPIAPLLDQVNGVTILWYFHILASLVGLAYLPFSKMFHIIATPLSQIVGAVIEKSKACSANIITSQMIEFDACTHCGVCNNTCSVIMAFEAIGNAYILPSEKMLFLKQFASGTTLNLEELKDLQEGIYLCTSCDRCTVACPSGINLKEIWILIREDLLQRGQPEPLILSGFSFSRGLIKDHLGIEEYQKPVDLMRATVTRVGNIEKPHSFLSADSRDQEFKREIMLSSNASTYSACFNCKTCTSVCPVVNNYDHPESTLGLLPHQIMYSLKFGLKELIFSSKMPWDCLTCYLCQEYCPRGVRITEVLYELKNMAIRDRVE